LKSGIELIEAMKLDPNGYLAVAVAIKESINEIYTFDNGFEDIEGIIERP